MNNSDEYKLEIKFKQNVSGMRLTLVDGDLNVVFDGITNKLMQILPQGVYHLKIFYLGYYQEHYFSLPETNTLELDFKYSIAPPALDYYSTHEYYSMDANIYSKKCTLKSEPSPNFFFFAALIGVMIENDPQKNLTLDRKEPLKKVDLAENWLIDYSIFNLNNEINIQFTKENVVFDNETGKIYFSTYLEKGLYFLQYENETSKRIFPVYIYDNYQTQFFIRYCGVPDFKNCRFFYSNKMFFDEGGHEYIALEKILYAFTNFKHIEFIDDHDLAVIKEHPYLVSLVNLLFASVVHVALDNNSDLTKSSPVSEARELELPDSLYCRNNENSIFSLSDKIPVLSSIFVKYTHKANNSNLLFAPASIIDRIIDHVNYDIFWTSFSKIEEPDAWKNIYEPLLNTIGKLAIDPSAGTLERLLKLSANTLISLVIPSTSKGLNDLIGKTALSSSNQEAINKLINRVKDVSAISKEFSLPPTTVLRDYDKYEGYFNKVKEIKSHEELPKKHDEL